MKKIKKSKFQGKHLPPLNLHYDQLQKIAEALTQDGGELTIETEEFEYANIEDFFANSNDNLSELKFSRRTPYISVDFYGSNGTWVYTAGDDLASKGIFSELLSILEPQVRKSHKIVKNFVAITGWIGAIFCGLSIGLGNFGDALLLGALLPLSILFSLSKHKNTINRQFIANKKSFWQRNSDQIIVAVIGAITGVVATLVIMSFFGVSKP